VAVRDGNRVYFGEAPGEGHSLIWTCKKSGCIRAAAEIAPITADEKKQILDGLPPEDFWTLDQLNSGLTNPAHWQWQIIGPKPIAEDFGVDVTISPVPLVVNQNSFPNAGSVQWLFCDASVPLPDNLETAQQQLDLALVTLAKECNRSLLRGPGSYVGNSRYWFRIDILDALLGRDTRTDSRF
jgi:hypothetical protein